MKYGTPFFKAFGPLLFPAILLAPAKSGANSRNRLFSLEVVFWAFLDQIQSPGSSCRETVLKIMAFRRRKSPKEPVGEMKPDTGAYCKARKKIPLETIDKIHTHLVERMQKNNPYRNLWHGRQVKLVDGTSVSMPDTPANQAKWPQSKSQKPGCGFPVMSIVALFCLATGALIKAATGNNKTHESILFKELWKELEEGDVLVTDRGFCSFGTFANLLLRKVDALMRLPENKIRRAIGAHLPKRECFDVIINWKCPAQRIPSMSDEEFAVLPSSIPVRVVGYTLARAGFRTERVILVTTLLDAEIKSEELAALYFRRWGIELHFREIKISMHMDVLRCTTPAMIECELKMHLVAYNLIRCVMQRSALTHDVDLNRLSFKGCLDAVRVFANATQGVENKKKTIEAIVDEMLLAIARDPNPDRPNRSEPRVRKRRPKNYRLLTKPRHEMKNLPHRKIGIEKNPKTT